MACYGILREFQEKLLKTQAPNGQGPNSSHLPGISSFVQDTAVSITQNFSPVTSHSVQIPGRRCLIGPGGGGVLWEATLLPLLNRTMSLHPK